VKVIIFFFPCSLFLLSSHYLPLFIFRLCRQSEDNSKSEEEERDTTGNCSGKRGPDVGSLPGIIRFGRGKWALAGILSSGCYSRIPNDGDGPKPPIRKRRVDWVNDRLGLSNKDVPENCSGIRGRIDWSVPEKKKVAL
jgi:hypothetical protein